jgi:hypothetical protein
MNFFLSTNLDTSLPQIRRYGIKHDTPIGNFSNPFGLVFHNLISGASIRLQIGFVGKTLYYITDHPDESTKNLNKCILVCLTKVSRPSFKQPRTRYLKSGIS